MISIIKNKNIEPFYNNVGIEPFYKVIRCWNFPRGRKESVIRLCLRIDHWEMPNPLMGYDDPYYHNHDPDVYADVDEEWFQGRDGWGLDISNT